ncbi:uncharacterized protein LOC118548991 [Halichoerus grypus]
MINFFQVITRSQSHCGSLALEQHGPDARACPLPCSGLGAAGLAEHAPAGRAPRPPGRRGSHWADGGFARTRKLVLRSCFRDSSRLLLLPEGGVVISLLPFGGELLKGNITNLPN